MSPKPQALLPLLLASLAVPLLAKGPAPSPDPERVRWVAAHAVAVRSIDPADEDFSDLLPLLEAIGKARVVQLGEATHTDGATFLAKGRLIRFLHQVMGFDVLAWESGFVDVRRVDAALRAGLPSAEAASRAIAPIRGKLWKPLKSSCSWIGKSCAWPKATLETSSRGWRSMRAWRSAAWKAEG